MSVSSGSPYEHSIDELLYHCHLGTASHSDTGTKRAAQPPPALFLRIDASKRVHHDIQPSAA
jgi:hypothetical protein